MRRTIAFWCVLVGVIGTIGVVTAQNPGPNAKPPDPNSVKLIGNRNDHRINGGIGQELVVVGKRLRGAKHRSHPGQKVGGCIAESIKFDIASLPARLQMGCLCNEPRAKDAYTQQISVFFHWHPRSTCLLVLFSRRSENASSVTLLIIEN